MKKRFSLTGVKMLALGLVVGGAFAASAQAADCPAGAICRYDEQPGGYTGDGPYRVGNYSISTFQAAGGATVYYPVNAQPPFAALVFCPPYTGVQYMYRDWGPFFASHGIVMVTMDSETTLDTVDQRAAQQREVLDFLKRENTNSRSALYGKLATDRFGVTGWSMGGGATWINSADYSGLKTAMSLAGHNLTALDPDSRGCSTRIPTLIMNGALDATYLGGLGQSDGVYNAIPYGVPKVFYEVSSAGHFDWGSPTSASNDAAKIALAFQKTFLEGDTRWAEYIRRPFWGASEWETANLP